MARSSFKLEHPFGSSLRFLIPPSSSGLQLMLLVVLGFRLLGCGENDDALPVVAKTPKRRTTLESQLIKFEDEDNEKARAAADAMSPVQDGLLIRKPPGMRFPSRRNVPMSADPVGHLHNGSSFDAFFETSAPKKDVYQLFAEK
ncbi:hypothetical protein ZEAMMB73_Zm00001d041986, partial [Zea mays]